MVLTISEEMSVNRLVNPSMTTVRLTGAVKRRETSRSPRFFSAWLALSAWYTLLLHGVAERVRTVVSTLALSLPGVGSGWAPSTVTRLRTNPVRVGRTVNWTVQRAPLPSRATVHETYPSLKKQLYGMPTGLTWPMAPNVTALDRSTEVPTSLATAGP